jgi:extracellular elastinolytic metalloproteinase
MTHVYFKQTFNDLEVENGDANINVDKYGRVVSHGNSFYSGPAPLALTSDAFVVQDRHSNMPLFHEISAIDAVMSFANFLHLTSTDAPKKEDLEEMIIDDDGSLFPGNDQEEPVILVSNVPFAADGQVPLMRKYLITSPTTLRPVWDLVSNMDPKYDNWFNAQVSIAYWQRDKEGIG